MVAALTCLLAICVQSAPDEKISPELVASLRSELADQVGQEIRIARSLVEIDEDAARRIEPALEPAVDVVARKFAQAGALRVPRVLAEELSALVVTELKQAAGSVASQKYERDVQYRQRLGVDTARGTAMVMVDLRVRLSSEQRERVAALLVKDWKDARFVAASQSDWELARSSIPRPESVLPRPFPEASLLKLLTPVQKKAWGFHKKRLQQRMSHLSVEVTESSVFADMLTHDVMIIVNQLKLSDKQRSRLLLLAKRTGQKTNRFQTEAKALKANYGPSPTKEQLALWEADSAIDPVLCCNLSGWRDVVASVLDAEQRAEFQRAEGERARRMHRARVMFQTHLFSCWQGWNADETEGMRQLFLKAPVDNRGLWASTRYFSYFVNLDGTTLSKSLSDEHLEAFQAWQKFSGRFHKNGPVD